MRFTTLLAVLAVSTITVPAVAQQADDEWLVGPITPSNGNRPFCRARSPERNGVAIQYRNYFPGGGNTVASDRGAGLLVFIVPDTDPEKAREQIPIADFKIDDSFGKRMRASWSGGAKTSTIALAIDDYVDQMIKLLASGNRLSLELVLANGDLKGKSYTFPLKGSYEAMIRFEACLAELAVQ